MQAGQPGPDGLFAAEPDRLKTLPLSAAGLELDLSKQPWSLADRPGSTATHRQALVAG